MKTLLENTGMLIIDVQEKLLPAMNNKEEIFNNIKKLVTGAMLLEIPAMATQQYPKGLGQTVEELMYCYRGNVATIDKTSFSALKNQDVKDWIMGMERKNIFICGMETHICVYQTAKELKELGFNPIVIADCVASRKDYDKENALSQLRAENIRVLTLEQALFEVVEDAKNDKFKEISKLIK